MKLQLKRLKQRVWKMIPYALDYQVSNDGRVRKVTAPLGVFLSPTFSKTLRPRYHFSLNGGRFSIDAHILVAQVFLPPAPPNKTWVLHGDDDPLNCTDQNLRWGDRWDNVADWQKNRKTPAYARGRKLNRQRHGPVLPTKQKKKYRLTPTQVIEIIKDGDLHKNIAARYGISRVQVSRIKNGSSWKGLPQKEI